MDSLETHALTFIGFSETKKDTLTSSQLVSSDIGSDFTWKWFPATSSVGGIFMGLGTYNFEIISWNVSTLSVSCILTCKAHKQLWRFIYLYVFVYEEHKLKFMIELHNIMSCWLGPTLIGGDFNLVRSSSDKSNVVVDQHW